MFEDQGIIARWSKIENLGDKPIVVEQVASATWNLPPGSGYEWSWLTGRWAAEWQLHTASIQTGQWSSRAGLGARHIRQIRCSQSAGVEKQPRKTVPSGSANLDGAAVGEWWSKVHRLTKSELLLDIIPSISHTSSPRESPWRLLCFMPPSRSTATVAHRACCPVPAPVHPATTPLTKAAAHHLQLMGGYRLRCRSGQSTRSSGESVWDRREPESLDQFGASRRRASTCTSCF
ncbi:MAG: alpha-galactosidase [Edaphobacter sp.]|nr:alpha-galactosidase [Edaphobacter sp.]